MVHVSARGEREQLAREHAGFFQLPGRSERFGLVSEYPDMQRRVDVRLAKTPVPSLYDTQTGRYALRDPDDEPTLSKPMRNPDTGELENKD